MTDSDDEPFTFKFRLRDSVIAALLIFVSGAAFGDGGGSLLREVWNRPPTVQAQPGGLASRSWPQASICVTSSGSHVTWFSNNGLPGMGVATLTSDGLAFVATGLNGQGIVYDGAAYVASDRTTIVLPVPK